jgi:hypothetical protein
MPNFLVWDEGPTPYTIWQGLVRRGFAYITDDRWPSTVTYAVSRSGIQVLGYRQEERIV